MEYQRRTFPSWLMADGAASISASMLVAVLMNVIPSFAGLWGLGVPPGTDQQAGRDDSGRHPAVTANFIRRLRSVASDIRSQRSRRKKNGKRPEGRAWKGPKAERERILRELERSGVEIPPEVGQKDRPRV